MRKVDDVVWLAATTFVSQRFIAVVNRSDLIWMILARKFADNTDMLGL